MEQAAVVSSPPDAHEMGWGIDKWYPLYERMIELCLWLTKDEAPAVLYATDRKANGQIYSKAQIILSVADRTGFKPLWHKIVLRRDVGKVDLHRPGYTHMIALSREAGPGQASPDVIPAGNYLYPHAMGQNAARFAVEFAGQYDNVITDPFCGRGTVLIEAKRAGLDFFGIDIDPQQVAHAKANLFGEA